MICISFCIFLLYFLLLSFFSFLSLLTLPVFLFLFSTWFYFCSSWVISQSAPCLLLCGRQGIELRSSVFSAMLCLGFLSMFGIKSFEKQGLHTLVCLLLVFSPTLVIWILYLRNCFRAVVMKIYSYDFF